MRISTTSHRHLQRGHAVAIFPRLSVLALCLVSAMMLPACGGGGGGGYGGDASNVRATPPQQPPPQQPPPQQPPPASTTTPPPHTTGADFQIRLVGGTAQGMANVSTPGSLTVGGDGTLVVAGQSRFDAGALVSEGELQVAGNLFSDVNVQQGARLRLINGNIIGDVLMAGTFSPVYDEQFYDSYYDSWGDHIFGDYTQTPTATMAVVLGLTNGVVEPLLDIHGLATLQGGTLRVDSAYVTAKAYAEWILRASDGVVGTFDRWTNASPLFIDGSLRYTPNDVYFDIVRISVAAAMTSSSLADASILSSAANVDRAFDEADRFALLPRSELSASQRQFLASAASIQRIGDHAQAASTLDSLSGQAHATAQELLLERAATPSAPLAARLDRVRQGMPAGAWTHDAGGDMAGSRIGVRHDVDGRVNGYDQWIGNRWLLGSSVGWSDSRMQFERHGGQARGQAPMANLYLHYRGDGNTYFTALAGYGRTRLTLDRPLDFGDAGRRHAHSERDVELAHVHAEAGRSVAVAGGRLTPFASVGYSALHGDGFVEHGNSGFELVAQPSRASRVTGGAGLRYVRDWRLDDDSWIQLDLGGEYRHVFAQDGDPIRAAFVATPMAAFELDGLPFDDGHGVLGFGLTGGRRDAWSWFLHYEQAFTGNARGDAWSLGMRVGF